MPRDPINRGAFRDLVSLGEDNDFRVVHKFGGIDGLTTTRATITSAGVYRMPTTAASLELVSDNVADAAAGSGARSVTIEGLDANWALQTVTTATNGTTAAAIAGTWMRVFRAYVVDSGTYASEGSSTAGHVGTITVQVASAGDVWAEIGVDATDAYAYGQSQIFAYTVPAGEQAYLAAFRMDVENNKYVEMTMMHRPNADDVTAPYSAPRAQRVDRGIRDRSEKNHRFMRGPFVGPCDIWFTARTVSGTAGVSGNMELLVEKV